MDQMIDSTQPANIPAAYDGEPAVRITVFANEAGQVFDREGSNASAAADAAAIKARFAKGFWSVAYVNESLEGSVTAALEAVGMGWSDASEWPAPGCYEWCADPSGNIAAGRWRPATTPVAVQVAYPGPYDLSNPHPKFPARVAGYIDGPASEWPPSAWARFATIPDLIPPDPLGDSDMLAAFYDPDSHQQHVFRERADGTVDHWYYTVAHDGNPAIGWQHEALPAPA